MKKGRIIIRSAGLLSALGRTLYDARQNFSLSRHFFVQRDISGTAEWIAPIGEREECHLLKVQSERYLYRSLDRSVLMAMAAAREAYVASGWNKSREVGVMIGSSRGATHTFEQQFAQFNANPLGRVEAITSPTTTLGNISSMVAQDLMLDGPDISHSITCSTALHGLLNAVSWIRSGMGERFLVGGVEAALTDFTVAQMKALRIYTEALDQEFPCRPLTSERSYSNSFALGEGAVIFAIDSAAFESRGSGLAEIDGLGWGIEPISTLTSISAHGECFVRSMRRAIDDQSSAGEIDLIVAHAPGSLIGDGAEMAAIEAVFADRMPVIVSPKWQIGHTFGASGAFGILYALHLLNQGSIHIPAYQKLFRPFPAKVSRIMVNAAGFGGNSSSVILKKLE